MWRQKEESSSTTLIRMTVLMTLEGTGTTGTREAGSGTSPSTCRIATWSKYQPTTTAIRFILCR